MPSGWLTGGRLDENIGFTIVFSVGAGLWSCLAYASRVVLAVVHHGCLSPYMIVQRFKQVLGPVVIMRDLDSDKVVVFLAGAVHLVSTVADMDGDVLREGVTSRTQAIMVEVGCVRVTARLALSCMALEVV